MSHWIRRLAPFACVLPMLCCTGCAPGGASEATVKSPAGVPADFTTRDIDGATVRFSEHLGKEVILVEFWTTWSKPSRADLVHLQTLYAARKARGFTVLAVSMDGPETVATVPQVARSYDVTFPVLLDEDTSISSSLNPKKSTPLSLLIDRSGRIVRTREGYNPGDEMLVEADVDALLDGRPLP